MKKIKSFKAADKINVTYFILFGFNVVTYKRENYKIRAYIVNSTHYETLHNEHGKNIFSYRWQVEVAALAKIKEIISNRIAELAKMAKEINKQK